jgi:deoxycytidylate deaminase
MSDATVKHTRPSWDEYFMDIVDLVSKRSTCLRRQVGALIVKDKRILTTGYNGAPQGTKHCLELGCLRDQLGIPSGQRHDCAAPPMPNRMPLSKPHIPAPRSRAAPCM